MYNVYYIRTYADASTFICNILILLLPNRPINNWNLINEKRQSAYQPTRLYRPDPSRV